MHYLILKKNKNKKISYNILLYNTKRKIKKKVGSVSYHGGLKKFVMTVDFIYLLNLFKAGVYFHLDFYKNLYKIINNFKL